MYRPNDLQNITYVWNNAEGLMGDDITFLVCRALIKLPPNRQEVGKVVGVTGRNVVESVSWASHPQGVMGKLLVDLSLQSKKNTELIKLALPYRALIKSFRIGEINPEVKYVHAKKVGVDSLLVEGIISLTTLGYLPWRGQTGVKGNFYDSSTIKISKSLPEVKEMVSAQVRFIPYHHRLDGTTLTLNGWKEIHLMYIAENNRGENVIVTRHLEPFTQNIILESELKSLGNLEISNGNVQSHVLASREVVVEGEFALTAQPAPFMMEMSQHADLFSKVKEMSQKLQERKKDKELKKETSSEEKVENTPVKELAASIEEVSAPVEEVTAPPEEINTLIERIDTSLEEINFPSENLNTPVEVILPEQETFEKPAINEELVVLAEEKIPVDEPVISDEADTGNENKEQGSKSIVILRESKRDRISKHMRKLK